MIEKWKTTLPTAHGRRKRTVYVYVPDGFDGDEANPDVEEPRFPVLYMFDGHNVFFDEDATYGKSWGMLGFLEDARLPLIVVAVDCDHGRNYARLKEYSPYDFEDESFGGRIHGRGKAFLRWMTRELKPMIDERYPTIPFRETTFLAGSSMGGLMTLYGLLAFNDVFSRGAALSPSIWVAPDKLVELARSAPLDPNTGIYMDYGSRELDNHYRQQMLRDYYRLAAAIGERGVYLTSRLIPGGEHCEACWEQQLPSVMTALFYEFAQPQGGDEPGGEPEPEGGEDGGDDADTVF